MQHYKSTALAIPAHIAFLANAEASNSSQGCARNVLCVHKESLQYPHGEKQSSNYRFQTV